MADLCSRCIRSAVSLLSTIASTPVLLISLSLFSIKMCSLYVCLFVYLNYEAPALRLWIAGARTLQFWSWSTARQRLACLPSVMCSLEFALGPGCAGLGLHRPHIFSNPFPNSSRKLAETISNSETFCSNSASWVSVHVSGYASFFRESCPNKS